MKRYTIGLIVLLLIVGCGVSGQKSVDINTLEYKSDSGIMTVRGSDEPYSGKTVWYYEK
jgi:hypothetical protein